MSQLVKSDCEDLIRKNPVYGHTTPNDLVLPNLGSQAGWGLPS